jgi:hypothetical protein
VNDNEQHFVGLFVYNGKFEVMVKRDIKTRKQKTTLELINSTEQSPYSEANNRPTAQEVICLSWNPKSHYHE